MSLADSTGGRRRLAGLFLLIGCAAPERRGAGGEERESLVVDGRRVAVPSRVVLWSEPGGFRATKFGERKGAVRQIVLHYDVAGTSTQCFKVLEARGLSCHFLVDLDGTIYQTVDTRARAYQAGPFNDGSVGIEIANIGAYAKREELERLWPFPAGAARGALPLGYVPRPARPGPIRGRIHGMELWQQDFTDAQYEALGQLVAALCGALDVPAAAPRETGLLPSPGAWHGILGHYHLTTDKVDPGPAFDWDRFLASVRANLGPAP
jgi:N-acetyl-anhydromuramyl-L-alanine amidase AmpD